MEKFFMTMFALILALSCVLMATACSSGKSIKIGVQSGTTAEFFVKGNQEMLYDGFSNAECMSYDSSGLAVSAMLNGQVNYVIVDNEPAKMLVAQNAGAIKMIDVPLTTEEYALGVDKNQAGLLESINTILAQMEENGKMDEIFEKYNSLVYDDDGNVIGGDENIVGIESAAKNNDNPQGQLVVATNAEFAPFEYKKGNLYVGIDMEIAQYIAQQLELELVIENMEFDSVVTAVGKNNIDVAIAGLSVTASRKSSVNFSSSYYKGAYQVLLVKADNTEFDGKTKEQIIQTIKNK